MPGSTLLIAALSVMAPPAPPACGGEAALLLNCVMSASWARDALQAAGWRAGDPVLVRCSNEAVPGLSPMRAGETNVAVYVRGDDRGVLFFLRGGPRGAALVQNAYHLTRQGPDWTASEGNGGLATYRAVGTFAKRLAKQTPAAFTPAARGGAGCADSAPTLRRAP